jgi:Domain of unknown function (DUF6894)
MARYFFDFQNGEGTIKDDSGVQLPSRAQVPVEVSRILADLARDELPWTDRADITITVRSEDGRPVSVANLTFTNEWA